LYRAVSFQLYRSTWLSSSGCIIGQDALLPVTSVYSSKAPHYCSTDRTKMV
jgi:hypothetical protein